jgi:hypothetical protein
MPTPHQKERKNDHEWQTVQAIQPEKGLLKTPPLYNVKIIAKISGGIVLVIGAAVLLGCALNIAFLKSVFPGSVNMKPNTAIGIILGGLALAFLSREKNNSPLCFYAAAIAVAIIALGTLTLGEYFFGWNLGIDNLLFPDLAQSVGTSFPGRMSSSTAFCFVLTGGALWVASQGILRRSRISVLVGLSATLLFISGF